MARPVCDYEGDETMFTNSSADLPLTESSRTWRGTTEVSVEGLGGGVSGHRPIAPLYLKRLIAFARDP
jgi:hypothetical protein